MGKDFAVDLGWIQTGLARSCFYRRYLTDTAVAVGDVVIPGTTDGRVQSSIGSGNTVVGVALDAAGSAGVSIRVAIMGVCRVTVDTGSSVFPGSWLVNSGAGSAGRAAEYTTLMPGSFTNGQLNLVGMALETSASGTNRLVWCQLGHGFIPALAFPPGGYPVDVGDAKANGTAASPPRYDHVHALGQHATYGMSGVGNASGVVYRHVISDEAIAVGDVLQASTATDGRVQKNVAVGGKVLGVALDAAGAAGVDIRMAIAGVCQVTCDTGFAVTRGDPLGVSSGQAGQCVVLGSLGISTPRSMVGFALETSASGSDRLVWCQLSMVRFNSPASAVPVDTTQVALSADGVATTVAASDHLHQAPGGIASLVAAVAIANTETVVLSKSLPANFMKAGTTFRIRAFGTLTTGATGGTSTFRLRIGTTTLTGNILAGFSVVNANSVTAGVVEVEFIVTIRTAGAAGTTQGFGSAKANTAGPIAFTSKDTITLTASVAVDTTATKLIEMTYISGNAGSTLTFQIAEIEVVKM